MLITKLAQPRNILFAFCLGIAGGACQVENDDDDDVGDDDAGDADDDDGGGSCDDDCGSAKLECEGNCDDDDTCVGQCALDFDDCSSDC